MAADSEKISETHEAKAKFEYDKDGFLKGFVCPRCSGQLRFNHEDDLGTVWFRCEKCGEQTPKPMLQKEHGPATPQGTKKIKFFALLKLKDDYGYIIRRTAVGYVLLDATFEGAPPDAVYSFKNLTSDKVKKRLAEYTEAPVELIERVLAELSVQAKDKRGSREQFENIQIVSSEEVEGEPVALDCLGMIESPDVAGKPVVVEAVVSSTSQAYLAPAEIEAHVTDKDGNEYDRTIQISEKNPINIKLVGVNEDIKFRRLKRFVDEGRVRIEEKAWRTVYKIRVRPPVFTLEKRGEKIVDEKGFEYKAYDIYVTSDKPITFQPSSLIRLEGLALPNPRTQKTTLLIYKVEFPEEVKLFDVEKLKRLKANFQGKTVKERLKWILDEFEKYSQIVGRRNLAKAGFLCFFTPVWVRFNGEIQKGWGNILIIGDTTTAKSETLRKLIRLLEAGMLITAETASTVGLTGTATQVEKEGWFVDWGFLVLCDRKMLAVDGAHKLSLSNWCVLAEAERNGVVTIAKAAKDSAYARTRQIKTANAVEREVDKYTTKSLVSFLYPCQALTTILDKTSIARLDLAVFSDNRDVQAEDINKEFNGDYDKDLETLSEALKWCWSNLAEVHFTKEAVETLLCEATNLYATFFCEMIPLASIDLKWKLARLSTALAYLTLSTEDFSTVEVTKNHVEEVVKFLKDEYTKVGLNTLAQQTKYEVLDKDDVTLIISRMQNTLVESAGDFGKDKIKQVLRYVVTHGRFTKDELRAKFSLSEKNELRPLIAAMKSEELIKVSRGFYPEPKLIQAYKVTEGFSQC